MLIETICIERRYFVDLSSHENDCYLFFFVCVDGGGDSLSSAEIHLPIAFVIVEGRSLKYAYISVKYA